MKERPIIFNAEMVRAVLAGRKTQTRRIVKHKYPQLWGCGYYATGKVLTDLENQPGAFMEFRHETQDEAGYTGSKASALVTCPLGKPGDQLWVRETWMPDAPRNGEWPDYEFYGCGMQPLSLIPDQYKNPDNCIYRASWDDELTGWKPSIHMPRWASRILLEVTDVRVERVQDISESDCAAEGIAPYKGGYTTGAIGPYSSPILAFSDLWESTGGDWHNNPWVWVIEFKVVEIKQ